MDNIPNCEGHGKVCMVKTGTSKGPNFGKSFFICAQSSNNCGHVEDAPGIQLKPCYKHPNAMIDLQTTYISSEKHEKRLYYRCTEGRSEQKNWCGFSILGQYVKPQAQLLKEHNQIASSSSNSMPRAKPKVEVKKSGLDFASIAAQSPLPKDNPKSQEFMSPNVWRKNEETKSSKKVYARDCDSDSDDDCQIVGEDFSKPKPVKGKTADSFNMNKLTASLESAGKENASEPKKPAMQEKLVKLVKVDSEGRTISSELVSSSQAEAIVQGQSSKQSGIENGKAVDIQMLNRDIAQKSALERQLANQRKILNTVNLSSLPDDGLSIKRSIDNLTSQINQIDLKIKSNRAILAQQSQALGNMQLNPKAQAVIPRGTQSQPTVTVIPRQTASGQAILPGSKQTLITNHVTKLPPHILQQMYAANPQAMTLYGGRMTAARLREVGSVTSEAIERLHKQLDTMPTTETEVEDPAGLKVDLMQHQKQALAWLHWREHQEPPGGILADDMGLGKTLTMISLVASRLIKSTQKKKTKKKKKVAAISSDSEDDSLSEEDDSVEKKDGKEKGEGWLGKGKCKGLLKSRATLVVCPASLVHQWDKEIERRCRRGLLKVIVYHGPNRERDINKLADNDVVLTTYAIVGKEIGIPEGMKNNKAAQEMPMEDKDPEEGGPQQPNLLRIVFERIILDEAHSIKNHKSVSAISACRLRAKYRWALTGTPIQNDLLDMYSLLRFLRCSPFDEYKVWKRQVDNRSENGTQRLNTLVKSLLLRRTKDQKSKSTGESLVSLPEKQTVTHEVALSGSERAVYDRIFAQSRSTLQEYLQRHEEKDAEKKGLPPPPRPATDGANNPWNKQDSLPSSSQGFVSASQMARIGLSSAAPADKQPGGGQILLLLLRLRQCCSHLSLMKDALEEESLETDGLELDVVEQMRGLALKENQTEEPVVAKSSNVFEKSSISTKIDFILAEMQKIKKNSPKGNPEKSVIVSQWTKMLEVVEHHLVRSGLRCSTIRGDVPAKKRADLVDAFNNDPKGPEVMLISLRAGGVGLNLIGGNHLFIIDMHWNPALEAQAADRIYRVGQVRNVFVHRFVCKGTVEEKILQLQKRKMKLATNILSGAGASANKLTLSDLRQLFGLEHPEPKFPVPGEYPSYRPASQF